MQAQLTTSAGETSDWYTLGMWAADDRGARRTSVSGQSDALGRVATDTLYARGDSFVSYRPSTEMVVEFWGRGPSADDLTWVDPSSVALPPQPVDATPNW